MVTFQEVFQKDFIELAARVEEVPSEEGRPFHWIPLFVQGVVDWLKSIEVEPALVNEPDCQFTLYLKLLHGNLLLQYAKWYEGYP